MNIELLLYENKVCGSIFIIALWQSQAHFLIDIDRVSIRVLF